MRARGQAGFTLLEVLIALAIVGALLTVAFGGLRVATAAWQQGENRAAAHQHVRTLAVALGRAVAATYPYRGPLGETPEARLLFAGTERRIEFVTQAPPFPGPLPVAFTAVVLTLDDGPEPALVVRQRILPNRSPFTEAEEVFRDPSVTSLELQYLDEGGWRDDWKPEESQAMPRAVKLTLGGRFDGRTEHLALTVSLRVAPPR
ncbi:MAG TPA: prepilin-type N-terminal cleavage/methylation domain-containing protein [Candidatus Tectomicrobia bacterium]|nr:prepilin-type N-terminal cleavage/methylation domain-containing protein [Candidatus Tectomicrobia bacterium]